MRLIIYYLLFLNISLFGASFDCAKASSNVEKMICSDDELSELDQKMSLIFTKAFKTSKYKEALKKQQIAWIKERNQCGEDIDCVINSYRDRLSVFDHSYNLYEKPRIPLSKIPYQLIVSQDDSLCKPLLEIYNQDIASTQKVNYSNHREFNWLKWKNYVNGSDDVQLIGGAFFDLNGDQKEEFVFGWYAHISGFQTEDYMIFDSKNSDFFKYSPVFGDFSKWPKTVLDFDNIGNSDPQEMSGIHFDLLNKQITLLPSYIVKSIERGKKFQDEWKKEDPKGYKNIGWQPILQKNEVRFLKWKDNKIYLVLEGSQRFKDRNQFNLVGKINQDYSFDAQCLFYKKNK